MSVPVYVPHIRLNEATRVFLACSQAMGHDIRLVDVADDDHAYLNHLRSCWERQETFINIEHDVVPWPGALESLECCPQMWCSFAYDAAAADFARAPLGLAKFTSEFIDAIPDVWESDISWQDLDAHLWRYATQRGHQAHQHRPSVLNANKDILIYLRHIEQTEL